MCLVVLLQITKTVNKTADIHLKFVTVDDF